MNTANLAMDHYAGWTDRADADLIAGWAANVSSPGVPVVIALYVNDVKVAQAACHDTRQDAIDAGYPGARQFSIAPQPFLKPGHNQVRVCIDHTGALLSNGSHMLAVGTSSNDNIGNHWSGQYSQKKEMTTRWWESDYVVRSINKRVCGESIPGGSAGLFKLALERFKGRTPFTHGVSVGCGFGANERAIIQCGLAERFTLYELSSVAVEVGRREAAAEGLAERMDFRLENGMETETQEGVYDLVFWNNALHHMFDTKAALEWTWRVLKKGGILLMDDFVGPDRMQWSDQLLAINTRMRQSIPQHYLHHPLRPGFAFPSTVTRPDANQIIAADPSECVDCGRILPELLRLFPDAWIKKTGGGIYHLGLNDILHNILAAQDFALLDQLLELDEQCVELGETHYAVAIAVK